MRDTFLFDLDGTLLPFDIDEFIHIYFREMGRHFHDMIDGKKLAEYIMASTEAMIKNLEPLPNEEKFMLHFSKLVGDDALAVYKSRFDQFYDERFDLVRECVLHVYLAFFSWEVPSFSIWYLILVALPPLICRSALFLSRTFLTPAHRFGFTLGSLSDISL
jgi:hypothetical protein